VEKGAQNVANIASTYIPKRNLDMSHTPRTGGLDPVKILEYPTLKCFPQIVTEIYIYRSPETTQPCGQPHRRLVCRPRGPGLLVHTKLRLRTYRFDQALQAQRELGAIHDNLRFIPRHFAGVEIRYSHKCQRRGDRIVSIH
jgi:hypothetical protein